MSNEIDARHAIPEQANGDTPVGYGELLRDIKAEIRSAHIRVHRVVNTELIAHYWRIGKLILERQQQEGWGTKVVDRLSIDLRTTFPGQRGYSRRSLCRRPPPAGQTKLCSKLLHKFPGATS